MKRYTFLLLAFFLTLSAHGFSVGNSVSATPTSLANVNSFPDRRPGSTNSLPTNVESPRSANELGNITESTQKVQQPSNNVTIGNGTTHLNNANPSKAPEANGRMKTSSLNNVSCKTYEGKIYGQGEAGYNDCIRTIKNDRQGTKNIP
jgi:hypothetical protein